jgi:hypothetical protein
MACNRGWADVRDALLAKDDILITSRTVRNAAVMHASEFGQDAVEWGVVVGMMRRCMINASIVRTCMEYPGLLRVVVAEFGDVVRALMPTRLACEDDNHAMVVELVEAYGFPLCECLGREFLMRRAFHARDALMRQLWCFSGAMEERVVEYATRLVPGVAAKLEENLAFFCLQQPP